VGLLVQVIDRPGVNGVASAQPASMSWTPGVIGLVVGALLALVGIVYSLTSGARLLLRTSGAVPADPVGRIGDRGGNSDTRGLRHRRPFAH